MSQGGQLKNDCFALPQGVEWTPVRVALDRLRTSLTSVVDVEEILPFQSLGRVLAGPVEAQRSHPPHANSAVDGYGFSHASIIDGANNLELVDARSAAGAAFEGTIGLGQAIRILTGAKPPEGVDTVVLQEDVTASDGHLKFDGSVKRGVNLRAAGEDVTAGETLLDAGRIVTVGDIALMASVGVDKIKVYNRLRVAVLSTGDELGAQSSQQIFDANRPMLTGILQRWGYEVVDLGQVGDDRDAVREALTRGAAADAIITTGGASAGDEDHMSALLGEEGVVDTWRIAIKPGRPLALGMWSGVPVFGLPGNPVAAFVCTLIFARPALGVLSGSAWNEPIGIPLSATFSKNKKPGRMECLRARRDGNSVEVFKSEGSGRVSGLSWADGLVALDHEQGAIEPGMPVTYIPFTDFGL